MSDMSSFIDTSILDFMMDVLTDGDFLSVVIDILRIIIPRLGLVTPGVVILMMTLTTWMVTVVVMNVNNLCSVHNNDTTEEEAFENKLTYFNPYSILISIP